MREDNIRILEETLAIIDRGSYQVNGKTVALRLSKREMESVHVLLPENVKHIADRKDFSKPFVIGRWGIPASKWTPSRRLANCLLPAYPQGRI